jgi:hypothetical protein
MALDRYGLSQKLYSFPAAVRRNSQVRAYRDVVWLVWSGVHERTQGASRGPVRTAA